MSSSSVLDILPDRCLSIIMREAIRMDPQSAKNFITCSRRTWNSDALIAHVSKLVVRVGDTPGSSGHDTIKQRIKTFPSRLPSLNCHACLRTLEIQISDKHLDSVDSLFLDHEVATKVANLHTLLICGTLQRPLTLSNLPSMLNKLPCLSKLRLPLSLGDLHALAPPCTTWRSLELNICELAPSSPCLKELSLDKTPLIFHPIALSASDVASLASLEVAEISCEIEVPPEGLHQLLTSSCLRHLSIPTDNVAADVDPMSLSSSTLTSLVFNVASNAKTAGFFLPLLQHLQHLNAVAAYGSLDIYLTHEERMFHWLSFLGRYECLDGELSLCIRIDDPDNPYAFEDDAAEALESMDKREMAERLRYCLQGLQGTRFAESVSHLGFDPTILPPSAVEVLITVFPRVKTLAWGIAKGPPQSTGGWYQPGLISMSLCAAASGWPFLFSITVGGITGGGMLLKHHQVPGFADEGGVASGDGVHAGKSASTHPASL